MAKPPTFLCWLCCALQGSLSFVLLIRETIVHYRTDPLSLSVASVAVVILSLGMLLSQKDSLLKFKITLAILHLAPLGASIILGMVGDLYIGLFLGVTNAWNVFWILANKGTRNGVTAGSR
jgi:hypothetical protein